MLKKIFTILVFSLLARISLSVLADDTPNVSPADVSNNNQPSQLVKPVDGDQSPLKSEPLPQEPNDKNQKINAYVNLTFSSNPIGIFADGNNMLHYNCKKYLDIYINDLNIELGKIKNSDIKDTLGQKDSKTKISKLNTYIESLKTRLQDTPLHEQGFICYLKLRETYVDNFNKSQEADKEESIVDPKQSSKNQQTSKSNSNKDTNNK